MLMKATPESPRMFESDFVDGFSRTPWWSVPLVWVPASLAYIVAGAAWTDVGLLGSVGLWVAGFITWTFAEYWLHRTIFHWWKGSRFHYIAHGVHHEHHQDRLRLVMPPAVAIFLCVGFTGLFWAALGSLSWTFMSGFILGYVSYDMIHYATHHLKWKNKTFQALKKHHLLHHHSPKYAERKYGVSSPFWDIVFRTN